MDRVDPVIAWLQLATAVMQIVILIAVGLGAWYALKTKKSATLTLNAIREYRREIGWLTARLEALEERQLKDAPNAQRGFGR
jgi:hypothetical protein